MKVFDGNQPDRLLRGSLSRNGADAPWTARVPVSPSERFDLKLVPRSPGWLEDDETLQALERIEHEPWVDSITRGHDGVQLRLHDGWIETAGAALEAGGDAQATLADLTHGERFSV